MKLKITDESYNILKTAIRSFSTILFVVMPLLNLYAQNGKVNFTDVTEQAGIDFRYTFGDFTYENILESSGSGITIFDYNNDELPDLYMLNGTYLEGISDPDGKVFKNTRNKLYKNNGDGTFSNKIQPVLKQTSFFGMGVDSADFNNDGWNDIFQLDMSASDNYRSKANMSSMNPEVFYQSVALGLHHQYMQNSLQLNNRVLNSVDVEKLLSMFKQK